MQIPQEMDFFQGEMGFDANAIVLFGVVQLVAGVLLGFKKSRAIGALVLAITLVISTIIIFMAGKTGFGLVSMLPIAMAAVVIKKNNGEAVITQKTYL